VLLAQHTIPESMLQCAIVIEQIHQQIRRIYPIDPLRNIFDVIGLHLAVDSIADNYLSNGFSAEQANVKLFHRCDPVGHAFFINLKAQLSIYISWMCKSEMTVYITVQMFTGRISDP